MAMMVSIHSRRENECKVNKHIKQSKINTLYGGYIMVAADKVKAPSNMPENALSDL